MSSESDKPNEYDRTAENKLVSQQPIVPFEDYREYLEEELVCVQYLIRAHLLRSVAFAEDRTQPIEAFLGKPFTMHRGLPAPELNEQCDYHRRKASELRKLIEARLAKTDERLLRTFPLWHVADQLLELRKRDKTRRLNTLDQDLLLIALLHEHWASVRAAIDDSYLEDGTLPGFLSDQWLAECLSSHRETPLAVLKRIQTCGLLSRCGLIQVVPDGNHPVLHRVRVDDTIADYLLNKSLNDRGLRASTRFVKAGTWDAVFLDEPVKQQLRDYGGCSTRVQRPLLIWLYGPAGTRFVPAVQALLSEMKISQLLVADVAQGMKAESFPAWIVQVQRYARLARAAILWNNTERMEHSDRARDYWSEILHAPGGMTTIVASEHAWDPVGMDEPLEGSFARFELTMPSISTRRSIWHYQLDGNSRLPIDPQHSDNVLDLLQGFQFTEGQIVDALTIAEGIVSGDSSTTAASEALYSGCRRVSAHGTVSFTQRIAPRPQLASLDAVVLSGESRQLLQELDDRIRHLPDVYLNHGFADSLHVGQGLVALFSGPSGTGKTLAATVLASKNQRDLYKVDMSAVVSKYVGETEKNLARIFSDAQSSNALLFFDEADSIFGKRGDVERAQDRWANMEVNYLLQRIEEFSGVVILATNLKGNIDEAFVRRVQVIIEFQPPDAPARAKILKGMFPPGTIAPSAAELEAYAKRFELNGGNLKNIVIDAAFRAVQSSQSPLTITMRQLIQATAREFRKLSRPVTAATFGKYLSELDGLVITPNG